jgi:hypothetical protein
MERRYEIRQEEVAYICDACREGEMLSNGICLTTRLNTLISATGVGICRRLVQYILL